MTNIEIYRKNTHLLTGTPIDCIKHTDLLYKKTLASLIVFFIQNKSKCIVIKTVLKNVIYLLFPSF